MGCTAPLTRCHPPDYCLERSRPYPPSGSGPGSHAATRQTAAWRGVDPILRLEKKLRGSPKTHE
eukprot:7201746-Prymnesium_polylepis.1